MSDFRFMPIPGVAPARIANRAIVGPFFTAAGFRGWYLACFPDSVVPVPQGLRGFWLAVSGFNLPIRGMGSLLANVMYGYGPRLRKRTEATLADTPDSQLREHVGIPMSQIRCIVFHRGKFAKSGLATPSIILETTNRGPQEYGVNLPDFERVCTQLQQMYPTHCKSR
jgi:hypothetical protein